MHRMHVRCVLCSQEGRNFWSENVDLDEVRSISELVKRSDTER